MKQSEKEATEKQQGDFRWTCHCGWNGEQFEADWGYGVFFETIYECPACGRLLQGRELEGDIQR